MSAVLASSLDPVPLAMGLAGGLAIFLFGMQQMTEAMKKAAGVGMRGLLRRLTSNRFLALITGAIVTAVVQSSSVTSVLVVGFVSAGLLSLTQSIGVIFGANVGTTMTAQLVAFDLSAYALGIVAVGFFWMTLGRTARSTNAGAALMGIGLIFFGMGLMGEATRPLRTYEPFIGAMQSMRNPILGVLAGAAFTAIVQSSSATTAIVIVLAGQGFISLESGIALALGANIGTCVTAALAAVGKPPAARQAAAVHVVFNLVGALLWLPAIGLLASIVREVSPAHTELEGAARLAADVPRQVANAHTIFNIANALLFLPFAGLLGTLVQRVLPGTGAILDARKPRFLDDAVLTVPSIAVERMRAEIARMGRRVERGIRGLHAEHGDLVDPATFLSSATDAEALYAAVLEYGRRIRLEDAGAGLHREAGRLILSANHLMSIVESVRRSLLPLIGQAKEEALDPSPETMRRLRGLAREVFDSLEQCLDALEANDPTAANQVIDVGGRIALHAEELHAHLEARLADQVAPTPIRRYRFEFALMEVLVRIDYFTQRIAANVALPAADQKPTEG